MTEENIISFGDALDAALEDVMSDSEATAVESDEATEDEAEEIAFEGDNSEAEDEVEAEADDAEEESEDEESEEEAEEEDTEEQSELPTLDEDDEVVIDGEVVKVKEALLRNADYTKKTQALAEERKAFEAEREQMSGAAEAMGSLDEAWAEDQSGVIATFLSNSEDVVDTVGDAVAILASEGELDPNMFVVKTILNLVSNDLIDEDLREMLGFDDETVARAKEQSRQDSRIRKLERQAKHKPAARQEPSEDAVAAARADLERQWNSIVEADENLSGMSEEAQLNIRSEVAKTALDRGGIPLDVAYELVQAKHAKAEAAAASKKVAATKKKRSTKAASKPTSSAPAPSPRDPTDLMSAIQEAMDELGG